MNENNLGGRIADLLKKSGLTQRELADKVGVTEVSCHDISAEIEPLKDRSLLISQMRYTPLLITY